MSTRLHSEASNYRKNARMFLIAAGVAGLTTISLVLVALAVEESGRLALSACLCCMMANLTWTLYCVFGQSARLLELLIERGDGGGVAGTEPKESPDPQQGGRAGIGGKPRPADE